MWWYDNYRKVAVALVVLGGMVFAVAWQGNSYAEGRAVLIGPAGQQVGLRVEVADTDQKRAYGLMNRTSLAADSGMLFVWPEPTVVSFWMRNTLIPLDMLFFRHGELVLIESRVQPHDETARGPEFAVDTVLEVNGGFAAARGIVPGWRLAWTPR